MGNREWLENKIQIRDKLRKFALNMLKLSEMFPNSKRGNIVNQQVTGSGTSMYVNY